MINRNVRFIRRKEEKAIKKLSSLENQTRIIEFPYVAHKNHKMSFFRLSKDALSRAFCAQQSEFPSALTVANLLRTAPNIHCCDER